MEPDELRELVAAADSPIKEGTGWWAYCPTHPDGTKHKRAGSGRAGRSLHISPRGIKCFSESPSCTGSAIMTALRAQMTKAPTNSSKRVLARGGPGGPRGELVRAYEYRDAEGEELLAVKGRFEWPDPNLPKGRDKTFLWRRPDATTWAGGVELATMPLYGTSNVLLSEPSQRVWFVEGEECVRALEARQEVAVCDSRGSSATTWGAGQLDCLRDRDVIVWADNDSPGLKHGRAVRDASRAIASRALLWQPEGMAQGGDVADFLAAGRSLDEFVWPVGDALSAYEVGIDGSVSAHRHTNLGTLHFVARQIQKDHRNGVSAVVSIADDKRTLVYSRISVYREEDRSKLARSAHAGFGDLMGQSYAAEDVRADMDTFCENLWEASLATLRIGQTEGADLDLAPEYLLSPYVLDEGGTVVFGPPGKGKSWIALLWAVTVDSGSSQLWRTNAQVPTLWINLERSEERFAQRLRRTNIALGLEPTRRLHTLHARGRSLSSILEAAKSYVLDEGIGCIFFDSISRAGMGKLTDDDAANDVIDALTAICPTWVAIAHTPRGDDTHEYGSVMFQAGQDVGVRLTSERGENSLGIGLEISKTNDAPRASQEVVSLQFDEFGITSARRATRGEYLEVEDAAMRPTHERIMDLLRAGPMTVGDISAGADASYDVTRKTLARYNRLFVRVPMVQPIQWALAEIPVAPSTPAAKPRPASTKDDDVCWCGQPVIGVNSKAELVCPDHMEEMVR